MKISPKIHNLFLQKITGLSKEQLFFSPPHDPLTKQEKELYTSFVQRLDSWEPLEYIIEKAEFYGLDFFVDQRVLIPRNDTEVMVEALTLTLSHWERGQEQIIYIDVWTGSWCIPVSVMKNIILPPHTSGTLIKKGRRIKCFAIDISEKALEVAEINIQNHWLEDKIKLVQWNLLTPLFPLLDKEGLGVVIISANLPYIKQDDFENMDESVYIHEPETALYWWENTWFELYEELIQQATTLSQKWIKIILFIEIGFDQKEVCENYLKTQGYTYEIFQDNWGVERCVKIEI